VHDRTAIALKEKPACLTLSRQQRCRLSHADTQIPTKIFCRPIRLFNDHIY
jgi:hypothetical protein